MPTFAFAYPISMTEDRYGLKFRCRDIPELRFDLPAGGNHATVWKAAEVVIDLVLEGYLREGKTLPSASARQPGELLVAPSPALIARIAGQMDLDELKSRPRAHPPVIWDFE